MAKEKKEKKSSFKRVSNFLTFLIILGFGGFVFYRGWIQLQIPQGQHALIYTKTGGYDNKLTASGEFSWRWENLLPTNLSITFLDLSPRRGSFKARGFLPSGELYGSFIGAPDSFRYNMDFSYSFRLTEEELLPLLQTEDLELSQVYKAVEDRIRDILTTTLSSGFIDQENLDIRLRGEMKKALPGVTLESLNINNYIYPDEGLYRQVQEAYSGYLQTVKAQRIESEVLSSQYREERERKTEILRSYGETFTEFPILLEYLGLDIDKIDPALF